MAIRNRLSMALHTAIAMLDQPAISQPPDQEHVGRKGRQAVMKSFRESWGSFWPGQRRSHDRSPKESARRIEAAIAKRQRRCIRNLRIAGL